MAEDKKYSNTQNEEDADKIAERGVDLELFVLLLLAQRINQIGKTKKGLTRAEMEEDLRKIAKQSHLFEILTKADTNRLLEKVLGNAYKTAQIYYDYTGTKYVPLSQNKPLQSILTDLKTGVLEDRTFHTQAFMLRNPQNRKELIPTEVSEAYNDIINEAAEQATNGIGDYASAIRETTKTLIDGGMKTVEYDTESGQPYMQSTEAAVKRNVLDNVRAINQATQDEVGKQFGSDGKEITVHEYSAPDHEPIQGHQFTNEEFEKLQNHEDFEDYQGRKFSAIKRAIGMWNCRHFTYSIILGLNKPNFTDEELEENKKRNEKGYTDKKGKHRTMYECTQEQRRLEREIRRAKMGVMVAKESGDIELARGYQMDVDKYVQQYKEFSEACGLSIKGDNIYVAGYKRIKI